MRATHVILIAMLVLGPYTSMAQSLPPVQGLDSIAMADRRTGWAVTDSDKILHTIDGGEHWTNVTPPNVTATQKYALGMPYVLGSRLAWVQSCALQNNITVELCTLFRTNDGGRSWNDLGALPKFQIRGNPNPVAAGTIYNFIDQRHGWLMIGLGALGSMDVDIHRTNDGGRTWVKIAADNTRDRRSGLPFAGQKLGITFLNITTGWITGYISGCNRPYLYVTRDSGRTWQPQRIPLPSQVTARWNMYTMPPTFFSARDGVLPVSLSYALKGENCEEGKTVVIVYTTHDGGNRWNYTSPVAAHRKIPVSFADVNHGWLADGGILFRTNDGGYRWTKIPLSSTFGDIKQLDFVSPQIGWAVRTVAPFLWRTLDGGQTWIRVD
jgi:photosystem II stability/assembly factor-like uncharacterized protein